MVVDSELGRVPSGATKEAEELNGRKRVALGASDDLTGHAYSLAHAQASLVQFDGTRPSDREEHRSCK